MPPLRMASSTPQHLTSEPDDSSGATEWEARGILDERVVLVSPPGPSTSTSSKKRVREPVTVTEYLIDWLGTDEDGQPYEPTWEPEEHCSAPLLSAWRKRKRADPEIVGRWMREQEEKERREREKRKRKREKEREEDAAGDAKRKKAEKRDKGGEYLLPSLTPIYRADHFWQPAHSPPFRSDPLVMAHRQKNPPRLAPAAGPPACAKAQPPVPPALDQAARARRRCRSGCAA